MGSTKNINSDILVSGGGIAGLSFAMLMANLGLSVHVVDPASPEKLETAAPSGRTVALMNNALNIIRATGLKAPESLGNPLEAMRIIDKSIAGAPPQQSDFEAFDIGLDQYGYNIPNLDLHRALFKNAQATKNLTLHCPDKLTTYYFDGARVQAELESGATITAQLIVGADGRRSLVRELAGIGTTEKPYGQSAMTFVLNHSKSHQNIATEFHFPSGPLALVPLQGNQSSVVWVEKTERADALTRIKKQELEQILADKTDNLLGGATLETGLESWPLCMIKAKSLTAPGTALIAEAAHVLSPITAQGLNLSLRDVAALAEILADGARAGLSLNDASLLKAYERRRALDMQTRTAGVDGMMRLVSNDLLPIKTARRAGFRLMDNIAPLKQFAMKHGLAPTIDQGRLAQDGKL